jgi:hypothetical protein
MPNNKTWSIECQITWPIASRAAQTSAPLVTQPSFSLKPTNQIKQRRQIPHRSTPTSVANSPAVSFPRGFSDACLRVPHRVRARQASENP